MDRISELPDEVMFYILTMLSIKDLLKTSVLSKRWCKLWSLSKDLNFNILDVLGSSEEELLQRGHLLSSSPMTRRVHLDINMAEFVKRVDQFLNNFQGTNIDSFSLSFYLNGKHNDIIDQWISFAIARGVERINLLLLPMPDTYATDPYKFSENNASTLKHLRLEHCLVCHPTNRDYIPFQNLRFLSFEKTKLDEMFIESLLSNCRWLEELHLILCEFRSSMPKIVSSSLCHLKVAGCYVVSGNYRMEIDLSSIDCLKLTSLEYNGYSLETVQDSKFDLLGILTILQASPLLHKLSVMVSEHG
jgi:hypothetical protein